MVAVAPETAVWHDLADVAYYASEELSDELKAKGGAQQTSVRGSRGSKPRTSNPRAARNSRECSVPATSRWSLGSP